MNDYSQWGEGKMIKEFFGDRVGRFLDLGAFDGLTNSNTRILTDTYWSGLMVEPNPFVFARLYDNHRENDKVSYLSAAVMPNPGLVRFWDCGQLSTATPTQGFLAQGFTPRTYFVPAVTPDQIVDQFGDNWNFVSFDLEGADLEVLRASNRLLAKTELVCVEDARPYMGQEPGYQRAMRDVLAELGFSLIVGTTSVGERLGNTLFARHDRGVRQCFQST